MQKTGGGEKNCICLTFHPFATSFFFCCCAQFIHFMNTKKGGFLHFSQAFFPRKLLLYGQFRLIIDFSFPLIILESKAKKKVWGVGHEKFCVLYSYVSSSRRLGSCKKPTTSRYRSAVTLLKPELQITNRKTNEFLVFPCTSHEEESEQILFPPLLLEKQLLCYTMRGLSKYKTLYSSQPSLLSSHLTFPIFFLKMAR